MKLIFLDAQQRRSGGHTASVSKNGRLTINRVATQDFFSKIDWVKVAIDTDEKKLKCVYIIPCTKDDQRSVKLTRDIATKTRGLTFNYVCEKLEIDYVRNTVNFDIEETKWNDQDIFMLILSSRPNKKRK